MIGVMIVQIPLLVTAGYLAGVVIGQKLQRKSGSWNANGIPGLLFGLFILFFWILPRSVPKWQLLGGVLGAFYVFVMVLIVPKVGVATSIMAVVAGQLVMSSIIDHFGLLGGQQIPFDMRRMTGIILLFCALWLFYKK
ncbi:putative inner membrane exporter YdcZ [Planifilum fimeticola]|uniref:Putative inner membrane exporter YdcZ n=1 Tax=Planifilum fimeticola TaxID=201975 RepID=A0A2T0LHS6_9BACL|nr:DMT family transporter [Planifilum fimeticola]PRX41922.1 putative inner membrane exporter YdcZ [Planifilum fimeticola]